MREKRNPARMDCVVSTTTGDGFDVQDGTRSGKIALSAERVRARLLYVWISYQ